MAACKVTHLARNLVQGSQGDPSPFFEPLLRSFLLGLGAAGIFESAHVASKVCLPLPCHSRSKRDSNKPTCQGT